MSWPRFLGVFLGMSFVLIQTPIYTDIYARRARAPAQPGRRPAARRGDDGRARHLPHRLRALTFVFMRADEQHDAVEQRAAARPAVT
jgi:hypothetical protein